MKNQLSDCPVITSQNTCFYAFVRKCKKIKLMELKTTGTIIIINIFVSQPLE